MIAVRTLSQLQARIARRVQRLDMLLHQPKLTEDAKRKIEAFELSVIADLKGQLNNRINWYMKCCGCA